MDMFHASRTHSRVLLKISSLGAGTAFTVWATLQDGALGLLAGLTATQGTFNIAIGTSPLVITSTTVNTNLNADLWDGYHFADYLDQAVKTGSSPAFANLDLVGDTIIRNTADNLRIQLRGGSAWYTGAIIGIHGNDFGGAGLGGYITFFMANAVRQTFNKDGSAVFGGGLTVGDKITMGATFPYRATQTIAAGGTWTPPRGLYNLFSGAAINLDLAIDATTWSRSPTVILACTFYFDGTRQRFYNPQSYSVDIAYEVIS